eukprot:9467360-Pyramimonas_sp.AAC.1
MTTIAQIAAPRTPRGPAVVRVDAPPLGFPGAHESGDSCADRSPQGTARSRGDPRGTYLGWASQEPTKVATVTQIAAPRNGQDEENEEKEEGGRGMGDTRARRGRRRSRAIPPHRHPR